MRGEPDGFRFRRGAEEEATEEEGERGYGENHLAVKGLGGGREGDDIEGGHPLNRRRGREREERDQRKRQSETKERDLFLSPLFLSPPSPPSTSPHSWGKEEER